MHWIEDHSTKVAFELAELISVGKGVAPQPSWLSDIEACRVVIEGAEANALSLVHPRDDHVNETVLKNKINVTFFAWAQDPASVPDVDDVFQRQNVMLRLWAGCTDTTKTMTRDPNPITPEERKRTFELHITPRSAECPIYAARSRAAVKFKVERKQRLELCADGP